MLNSTNVKYFSKEAVLSMGAERLYRLAEDNFFHFEKPKKALNLIEKSLELSPNFIKSMLLKADILLFSNKLREALSLYQNVVDFKSDNPRALASLAACLDMNGEYFSALKYCNLAFEEMSLVHMNLYPSLYELKFNLLIKLKKFNEAKYLLNNSVYDLTADEANFLRACNQKFIKKGLAQSKKIKQCNLKVI